MKASKLAAFLTKIVTIYGDVDVMTQDGTKRHHIIKKKKLILENLSVGHGSDTLTKRDKKKKVVLIKVQKDNPTT